ncbi:hypothetical protein HK097_004686 [Rhizophlyctis rosea]|uniref:Uncharacterized protein n=1 Tax=Rhizophlyctis rosea TaxID=64517 RepID=A0AAD5WYW2_9FUNG|nr:hypothetical protein HK097_004686 [Rhizophlyctis rosea]
MLDPKLTRQILFRLLKAGVRDGWAAWSEAAEHALEKMFAEVEGNDRKTIKRAAETVSDEGEQEPKPKKAKSGKEGKKNVKPVSKQEDVDGFRSGSAAGVVNSRTINSRNADVIEISDDDSGEEDEDGGAERRDLEERNGQAEPFDPQTSPLTTRYYLRMVTDSTPNYETSLKGNNCYPADIVDEADQLLDQIAIDHAPMDTKRQLTNQQIYESHQFRNDPRRIEASHLIDQALRGSKRIADVYLSKKSKPNTARNFVEQLGKSSWNEVWFQVEKPGSGVKYVKCRAEGVGMNSRVVSSSTVDAEEAGEKMFWVGTRDTGRDKLCLNAVIPWW